MQEEFPDRVKHEGMERRGMENFRENREGFQEGSGGFQEDREDFQEDREGFQENRESFFIALSFFAIFPESLCKGLFRVEDFPFEKIKQKSHFLPVLLWADAPCPPGGG